MVPFGFQAPDGHGSGQYLIELKLYRAMELLSESRMTVKEIAYALDFNSSRYFSSFFKKGPAAARSNTALGFAAMCRNGRAEARMKQNS